MKNDLEVLNSNIQSCNKCDLCKLEFNIKDVEKGFGKLYAWQGWRMEKYINKISMSCKEN